MNIDEFVLEVKKLGIDVTEEELNKLDIYYNLLIDYNKKVNLTAITLRKDVYLKHFYDSLTIVKIINLDNVSLCDIGTGAGFPGIVLKIFFPSINLTLVDALNKRINFLNEVVNTLKLDNVNLVHARAEEYGKLNREKFDVVTARALASFNVVLEFAIPILKVGGYFVAMRGINDSLDSVNALKTLNAKIIQTIGFNLPIENSQRTLIKIEKLNQTNVKYPRRFNEIKNNSL